MDDKRTLRRQMRRMRASLTPEALCSAGLQVAERLLALPVVQDATGVFVFLAVRREVPTAPLIGALLARGTRVAVPRIADGAMQAVRLVALDATVPGAHGIPTSDGETVHDLDVAICPGLAFDRAGRRLGYGGAYYDRWLANHPAVRTIGIAVDGAIVDGVPTDPHDRLMDLVVTPTATYGSQSGPNDGSTSR